MLVYLLISSCLLAFLSQIYLFSWATEDWKQAVMELQQKSILEFFQKKDQRNYGSAKPISEADVEGHPRHLDANRSNGRPDDGVLHAMQVALQHMLPASLQPKVHDPVAVVSLHPHFIPSLRQLNAVLLPIYYSDRLYREVLLSPRTCKLASYDRVPVGAITSRLETRDASALSRLTDPEAARRVALVPDADAVAVHGQLAAALQGDVASELALLWPHEHHMYIMTLGVLPTYRRLGIGARLVDALVQEAERINLETAARIQARIQRQPGPDVVKYIPADAIVTCLSLHVQENNTLALHFYERHGFQTVHFVPNYYKRVTPRGAYIMVRKLAFEQHLQGLYPKSLLDSL